MRVIQYKKSTYLLNQLINKVVISTNFYLTETRNKLELLISQKRFRARSEKILDSSPSAKVNYIHCYFSLKTKAAN